MEAQTCGKNKGVVALVSKAVENDGSKPLDIVSFIRSSCAKNVWICLKF